jgi:hypothetical protein
MVVINVGFKIVANLVTAKLMRAWVGNQAEKTDQLAIITATRRLT